VARLTAATLPPDGGIAGTVTKSGGGGLPGVCVSARSVAAGSQAVFAVTAGDGSYSIAGLAPGSYLVEFSSGCGASGYRAQWWNDTGAEVTANVVRVSSGVTTTGIGASMRR
jgi:Carboxypeptidase regulatory-like domain